MGLDDTTTAKFAVRRLPLGAVPSLIRAKSSTCAEVEMTRRVGATPPCSRLCAITPSTPQSPNAQPSLQRSERHGSRGDCAPFNAGQRRQKAVSHAGCPHPGRSKDEQQAHFVDFEVDGRDLVGGPFEQRCS